MSFFFLAVGDSFDNALVGVTTRFVQNCTLSCPWHERGGNIAQRPEVWRSIAGGPNVIAGQRDMFPAEGCDVGKEIIGMVAPRARAC